MMIEISNNEAWKILDAIEAYKKDYAVNGAVEKTLNGVVKKLKDNMHSKE
jgi:hypothetical protein